MGVAQRASGVHRTDRRMALGLFMLYAVLFFITQTDVHNYADDALSWAVMVDEGCPAMHKHHLLYLPLGRAVTWFLSSIGDISTIQALQLISVLSGALGLSAFFLVLRIESVERRQAIAWTLFVVPYFRILGIFGRR